jgi:hypothetical protein
MEVSGQHHAPVALPPGKNSGTKWVGSRVGLKGVLSGLEKTKSLAMNQPTRCNNFPSLLLDVYVQLNMFRASSRPSSGAQQMQ